MALTLILAAAAAQVLLAALAPALRGSSSRFIVYGGAFAVSATATAAALAYLLFDDLVQGVTLPLGLPWLGAHFRLDALSAFFLIVVNFGAAAASAQGAAEQIASEAGIANSRYAHEPLARHRGANWAVPEAGTGAVPIRRTIHLVVRHDRLALLPEAGASSGRVIPVEASIERAVDPLVEAVAESIQSWGTAGRGLYWQPILVFTPGPDGVAHTAALRRLLAGSGLEVTP